MRAKIRRLRATVRVRTTIAATAGLASALVLAAVIIVHAQRADLRRAITESARSRAGDIAALVTATGPTGPPQQRAGDGLIVQIVDQDGVVVGASKNIAGQPPISNLRPPIGKDVIQQVEQLPDNGNDFAVIAETVQHNARTYTVIVAASLENVTDATENLAVLFAVMVPLLILTVGITTWLATGRALAPVDAIRARVEAIESVDITSRVPEPDSQDEIANLSRTMNHMLDRLQKSNMVQKQFVADASHEMRSPLTAMRSQLEVGITYDTGEQLRDAASRALDEVTHMQNLVEDLLVLSRLDDSTAVHKSVAVDLDDVVFDEVTRVRKQARPDIDTSAVSNGRVNGDPAQLRRAVRNLLENASRHGERLIIVSLREHDGIVTLRIDNDGPTVPADQSDWIFERFTRLDQARNRSSGGSGLGLAIVRDIVLAHHGNVRTENCEIGARFTVTLPVATV